MIDWLLDSDPAIRWQVMRDLLDAPEAEWRAERARVETEGWGARLLACQDPDGQWAGGAFAPADFSEQKWREEGQPWTATCWALTQLREFGLDPASDAARRTVALVGANSRWEEGGQPYWEGEVEECINGRTVADGAYFGVDVGPIVARLLGERQADGGWNCERANGSLRSSFDTTINVSKGCSSTSRRPAAPPAMREARRVRRGVTCSSAASSAGSPPASRPTRTTCGSLHPNRWRYDILRGARLLPRGGRRRTRGSAKRSPSSRRRRLAGRPLAARLDAARAGLVRSRRRTRRAVALDHAPRAPGAQRWWEAPRRHRQLTG